MLRSILIGLVAGARSMTPLAVVANAARTGTLPQDNGAPRFLANPLVSLGATALATYELIGDKQKSAPDRIIPPAVIIRSMNAAFAGMALAPRNERFPAAAVAGATAVLASYATFAARMVAMRKGSQFVTGVVEDAIAVSTAVAAARAHLPELPAPTRQLSAPH
ncbi:DUF4126 domain-containing protein [Sphingomonas sp. S2-65]|uniref:DUF4126 domain-containing protein n=1 Tax=Sphingomonas sp. S2-65 TaxID=2903960 RepID=UPI001F4197A5|nr:DUF4126 domain-containing protein [Sphingomonas sp. S2-65]UYY58801.1 DUF4126 domain-containing protein [Sphingomonas sp. S2-65]